MRTVDHSSSFAHERAIMFAFLSERKRLILSQA